MTNFKGTKGKWVSKTGLGLLKDTDCYYRDIKSLDGTMIAEAKGVHHGTPNREAKANALLISKAPEMLEMLENILSDSENSGSDYMVNEIKRLIKEATEL